PVGLGVRCSGAWWALLVNGRSPQVRIEILADTLADPAWEPVEIVGLPVDTPWRGTDYDTREQGLVTALGDPVDAALARLERAGPPVGWSPVTATGRFAPRWVPPDPALLVKEVRTDLLPHVEQIYRRGLTPGDQRALVDSPPVDPPSNGARSSSLPTTASLSPLSLLMLPASADPFLALATGFGTGYPAGSLGRGAVEHLVTAEYPDTPFRDGPVEMAAYVPPVGVHRATVAPQGLSAERAGLVAPQTRDAPWRESIVLRWDRVRSTAAMGRPTGGVPARFDTFGGPGAQALVERRAAGDLRPLVLVPDGPEDTPGDATTSMVDPGVEIPLGSGGRDAGYPVTVQDVFGVFSPWVDARWVGDEPRPPGPRVLGLTLESTYAGTPTCSATLELELAVEWADRTPDGVDLAAVFFRTTGADAPIPPGVGPTLPAPAGAFRRDLALTFVGDELTAPSGVRVRHLDEEGDAEVPPGPAQGDHARRYRLSVPVPVLDFGSTPRWAVQVWLRTSLLVVPGVGWLPDAAHPALAVASSPVPVAPIPPPLPPGVPLGSTPDAERRSHARVHWSVPAGAPLDPQRGIVLWECAETALRQTAGLAARAPGTTLPGVRLAELWAAYDGLTPDQRRAAFRRVQTLPGSARQTDVALPPGSTDIHLFAVTTLSTTGVDSPWPGGTPAHAQLQAVAAPRLRRPAPPRVRTVLGAAGTVTVSLSAPSDVPVARFLLYRTRSAQAALRAETMGPAFAGVPASAPAPGTAPDPASGQLLYTGSWSGAFSPAWEDWHVRAVAVPVDGVPVEAVRGLPSEASDVVLVRLRPGGPDLGLLEAHEWGPGSAGVLVLTSTSAPLRQVPDGTHRLSGGVSAAQPGGGEADLGVVDLVDVAEGPHEAGALGAPAPGAPPALLRGPRVAGRTPLALWFTRPVAADPVDVVLRLTDPLGRSVEQRLTVPGHVDPVPPTLDVLDVFTISGRGTVIRLRSDASLTDLPPTTLAIVVGPAKRRIPGRPVPGLPGRPRFPGLPGFPDRGDLLGALVTTDRLTIALVDIPTRSRPGRGVIQVVRSTTREPHEYEVMIRRSPDFTARFTLTTGDGRHVTVSRTVRS
uniref:hypothetical protein n=1 Tax=Actinotalea sp. TaxID=1872145 RepID=UPI003567684A